MSIATIALTLAAVCLFSGHANALDSTAGKTGTMDEAQGTPPNKIIPKRHGPTVTPKTPKVTPTAATSTPYSKQLKSLTKAPISCIESCRAACAGPKKGKSACGPAYDSCVAEC
jgi:hypothetical protein